jgi:hypothetical protein
VPEDSVPGGMLLDARIVEAVCRRLWNTTRGQTGGLERRVELTRQEASFGSMQFHGARHL